MNPFAMFKMIIVTISIFSITQCTLVVSIRVITRVNKVSYICVVNFLWILLQQLRSNSITISSFTVI